MLHTYVNFEQNATIDQAKIFKSSSVNISNLQKEMNEKTLKSSKAFYESFEVA